MGPPLVTCFDLSLRVRSGLIAAQCSPPSAVLNTTLPPNRTTFASVGETSIGVVQLKRSCRSAAFRSCPPERYGRMERVTPVLRSTRVTLPFWESTYSTVESLGAGTAYSPSPPATVNHSAPVSAPPKPAPAPPPPPPPPPRPPHNPPPAFLSPHPPPNTDRAVVAPATTSKRLIRQ